MILVKAPLRISFVGGGTDFEDFYQHYPGRVISTTIDQSVYINVSRKFDGDIRVSYSQTEIVPTRADVKHTIARAALEKLEIENNVEIVTLADVPSGTGLASSSAFAVGLLQGLHALKGETISTKQLAQEACDVEIDMLKEPIGKQDQYAVAYGGLNVIHFNSDVTVSRIVLEPGLKDEFQKHLMFFYMGKARAAGSILKEQKENISAKFEVLKAMSDMVVPFGDALKHGNFKEVGELLHEGWMLKKELATNISYEEADLVYEFARCQGAWGGKILGAGGGGFLMLCVPPEKQEQIRRMLSWREVDIKFSNDGSKIVWNNT